MFESRGHRLWFLPAFVFVLVLLSACASKSNLPPPTPLAELRSKLDVDRVWLRVNIAERQRASQGQGIYADESVFLWVDKRGKLHANHAQSGKSLWVVDVGAPISSRPGVKDELIYVVTQNAELVALNKKSGEEQWRSNVSSEALVAPVVAEGIVIVYCVDGSVFGLNVADGGERWRYHTKVPVISLRGNATPVVANGRVIVGLSDGRLAALDLWSGKEKWLVSLAKPRGRTELERMVDVDTTPVVMDGIVYTAAYQGQVVALQLRSGRVLWSFDISTAKDIAVSDEHIYLVDEESVLYALGRKNGRVLWKQDALAWRYATAPTLYNGYLVVGDLDGYLHWLDSQNGRLVHRVWTDFHDFDTKPVVADDKLYAMSRAGIIDVLQLRKVVVQD